MNYPWKIIVDGEIIYHYIGESVDVLAKKTIQPVLKPEYDIKDIDIEKRIIYAQARTSSKN